MRQWWRKAKSKHINIDGVTAATRRPDSYSIKWDGLDLSGQAVPQGTYLLNIEVAREEGGRDYIRQSIQWPKRIVNTPITSKKEITNISFQISENQ